MVLFIPAKQKRKTFCTKGLRSNSMLRPLMTKCQEYREEYSIIDVTPPSRYRNTFNSCIFQGGEVVFEFIEMNHNWIFLIALS